MRMQASQASNTGPRDAKYEVAYIGMLYGPATPDERSEQVAVVRTCRLTRAPPLFCFEQL